MKIIFLMLLLVGNCARNFKFLENISKNINDDLSLAVEKDYIFRIISLINNGADVNYINKDNKSIIEIAIDRADIEIVKVLIREKVKINKIENLVKIYELALDNFRWDIIDLMQTNGYEIDENMIGVDKYFILLCYAADNLRLIEEFIQCNGIETNQNNYALNLTLLNGKIETASFLIKKYEWDLSFKDSYSGKSALLIACQKGYVDIAKLLLGKNSNVNDKDIHLGRTSLHLACEIGSLELAELLLKAGADANVQDREGNTPLMSALFSSYEIVKILLENDADPDIKDIHNSSSLEIACIEGNIEIVKLLIKKGANINSKNTKGHTPLMNAVEMNHTEAVNFLIENGAELNCRTDDKDEMTPLILACQNLNIDVVRLMIEKGADIFCKDKLGANLIYYASVYCFSKEENREELIDFLLEKGLNIDEKREDGWTPLMVASFNNDLNGINLLLKKGANIDDKNDNGFTSLIIASQQGKTDSVKFLLKNGANVNIKEHNGMTALMLAIRKGYRDIVELLLEKGYSIDSKN